jgi:hypothetical protein
VGTHPRGINEGGGLDRQEWVGQVVNVHRGGLVVQATRNCCRVSGVKPPQPRSWSRREQGAKEDSMVWWAAPSPDDSFGDLAYLVGRFDVGVCCC